MGAWSLACSHKGRRKARIIRWGQVTGDLVTHWSFWGADYGVWHPISDTEIWLPIDAAEQLEMCGYRITELRVLAGLPRWRRWLHNLLVRLPRVMLDKPGKV